AMMWRRPPSGSWTQASLKRTPPAFSRESSQGIHLICNCRWTTSRQSLRNREFVLDDERLLSTNPRQQLPSRKNRLMAHHGILELERYCPRNASQPFSLHSQFPANHPL